MVWNDWMRTIEWNPWKELDALERDWNRRLEALASDDVPPVRVEASTDAIRLTLALPGRAPEDVEVTLEDKRLVVRGKAIAESVDAKTTLVRREFSTGAFERAFELPWRVASDAVKAKFENGLLAIELPRVAEERSRRITIAT